MLIPFNKEHDIVHAFMLLILLICELQTLVLIVHELIVLQFSILVLIKEEQTIDEQVCILQFIVLALIYETFTVLEETVLHVNNEVFVLLKEQFLPYANDTFVTAAVKLAVDVSLPINDDVEQHTYIPREQDNFDTFMFAQFNKNETFALTKHADEQDTYETFKTELQLINELFNTKGTDNVVTVHVSIIPVVPITVHAFCITVLILHAFISDVFINERLLMTDFKFDTLLFRILAVTILQFSNKQATILAF